jgi:non-lysosomal glucosylceramidase
LRQEHCVKASRPPLRIAVILVTASLSFGQVQIPKAAWSRPIGLPLENPGHVKPELKSSIIDDGYWQGAPVGGFGAGTFSRTYRGDFARWHIKAGIHKYQPILEDQFSVYQRVEGETQAYATVLYAGKPEGLAQGPLSRWNWDYPVGAGKYYSLYPKSWFEYRSPKLPVNLTVEQFSPILPNNYKETSYPVVIYNWHAENRTSKTVTVSVMFTWQNMVGWFRDYSTKFQSVLNEQNTNRFVEDGAMKGIVFDRIRDGNVIDEWDGQFAIAAMQQHGVEVSYLSTWTTEAPVSPGNDVWGPFSTAGRLPNTSANYSSSGEPIAGAIAVTFTLKAGEKRTVPIVLAWDLPVIQFGGGRKWYRKYTDFFGRTGTNAWAVAKTGLQNADAWSKAIDDWQRPYISDESKPLWYRGMLFNELYGLADLGSVWAKPMETTGAKGPLTQRETFSWLECFDYPYYETLDVRFYGSMPLALFWPDIEKNIMRAFSDTVPREDPTRYIWQWKTERTNTLEWRTRKMRGSVPHDLGVPKEDPFFRSNQFSWQNTVRWKDLNSKFVLMVWRDYVYSGKKDRAFLEYTWPSIKLALDYLKQFDVDGSGLPDGEGFPDQTYDTWVVHGDSAYSGGLYLAALRAGEEVAKLLGDLSKAKDYHAAFLKGQKSYIDKLWTGDYFRYDVGSSYRDNIQADQLAGQWYADLTGLGDIVPLNMKYSALRKIYDFNVKKFHNGERGAINGMSPVGQLLTDNEQIEEVWTGTTLGVAAHMRLLGMNDEAYGTAWGVYHTSYETHGYWFRTPEAWNEKGEFRASMYMRPGAIWAMEMKPPNAK